MEKSYEERQAECGLKVGDKVRILRKAEDHEDGWGDAWNHHEMDDFVGRECEILRDNENRGFRVYNEELDEWWNVPYFILEKVSEEPEQEQKETPKEGFSKFTFHFTNGEVLSFVGNQDDEELGVFYDENGASYAIALEQINYMKEEKI